MESFDVFELEIDVSDAVSDLRQLARALKDKSYLKEAGLYMERETKINFARQSAPDGTPWAPLAPSTLARKRSGAILRETSALVNSIAARGPFQNTVRVGATMEYGVYHQFGTKRMPARPFLGIEPKHHEPIRKIVEAHLARALS